MLWTGAIHTAAYWLLHTPRGLAPKTSFWRNAQFDTLRLAFVKVAARVTELVTRIKVSLPSSYPYKASLACFADRTLALPPCRPDSPGEVPVIEPLPSTAKDVIEDRHRAAGAMLSRTPTSPEPTPHE